MGTPHRVRTRRLRVAVAGRHAPARGRSWVGAEIRHAQRPARRSAGPAQARPAGPGLPVVRRPDTCPRRRSAVSAQSWTERGTSACGRRTAAGPQRSSRARARCRRCPGPAVLRTPTTWFTALPTARAPARYRGAQGVTHPSQASVARFSVASGRNDTEGRRNGQRNPCNGAVRPRGRAPAPHRPRLQIPRNNRTPHEAVSAMSLIRLRRCALCMVPEARSPSPGWLCTRENGQHFYVGSGGGWRSQRGWNVHESLQHLDLLGVPRGRRTRGQQAPAAGRGRAVLGYGCSCHQRSASARATSASY